jgi:hypothetical protein
MTATFSTLARESVCRGQSNSLGGEASEPRPRLGGTLFSDPVPPFLVRLDQRPGFQRPFSQLLLTGIDFIFSPLLGLADILCEIERRGLENNLLF